MYLDGFDHGMLAITVLEQDTSIPVSVIRRNGIIYKGSSKRREEEGSLYEMSCNVNADIQLLIQNHPASSLPRDAGSYLRFMNGRQR